MNIKETIAKLGNYRKGSFIRIGWRSEIGSKAAEKLGIKVTKESEATVRLGVNYSHLKKVREKLSLREENGRVPWFQHSGIFNLFVEHKKDNNKQYLQVFPIGHNGNPRVRYFINGVPITKEELQKTGYCNESTFAPKGDTVVFNIPVENIRFIGKN